MHGADLGSDIDLLLVSDAFPVDPMERQRVLYELSPGGIDIFAYTRSEHAGMLARNHPTVFWARLLGVLGRAEPSFRCARSFHSGL